MKVKELTGGDCFIVSGKTVLEGKLPNAMLVHAIVGGQGALKGKKFSHAWVELGDVVFDFSNNRHIIMRKEQYYKLGKIKPIKGKYQTYTREQMLEKINEFSTWGPWDLKE